MFYIYIEAAFLSSGPMREDSPFVWASIPHLACEGNQLKIILVGCWQSLLCF
jgi:hypothetical protein